MKQEYSYSTHKNGIIKKFWNTIAENVVPEINTIVLG